MSIETLLEAAKFLELQALQQQKARGKKGEIWGRDWISICVFLWICRDLVLFGTLTLPRCPHVIGQAPVSWAPPTDVTPRVHSCTASECLPRSGRCCHPRVCVSKREWQWQGKNRQWGRCVLGRGIKEEAENCIYTFDCCSRAFLQTVDFKCTLPALSACGKFYLFLHDDQASTSTASEGEDNIDEDIEDEILSPMPSKSHPVSSLITQHMPIPHKLSKALPPIPSAQLSPVAAAAPITAPALTSTPAQAPNSIASAPATQVVTLQTLPPAQTHIVTTASLQPSVIAHAGSASHASVIQTVNRVIQPGSKHVAHISPPSSSSVQLAPGPQSISHITVAHLPAIYSQPVTVTQPAVMSHIAQTLSHGQMNGTSATSAQATVVGKQTPVGAQMVTRHPQLVGQTVLNPVTMVTMPSFPVSTLKLA
uniref:MAX network transcriptional repressor a n=1 Tax=Cyprinus carpio TaxID=7962 RepID=A0A8C1YIE3_CYPCA